MRFFLDENFPKAATALLREHGHHVFDVRGTAAEGSRDEDIFLLAQQENAVFLTTDKDFFHTIPHLHENHSGIVVVSLHQPNRKSIIEKLQWLLDHCESLEFESRVYLIRDRSIVVFPR